MLPMDPVSKMIRAARYHSARKRAQRRQYPDGCTWHWHEGQMEAYVQAARIVKSSTRQDILSLLQEDA